MSEVKRTLLTATEVAKQFEVSPSTVARWARDGLMPTIRTPGGRPRFRPEDVDRFLEVHGEPAA